MATYKCDVKVIFTTIVAIHSRAVPQVWCTENGCCCHFPNFGYDRPRRRLSY